jgi:hypothetical protein
MRCGAREKHLDGGDHEQHGGKCRYARQQSEDRQKPQDEAEGSSPIRPSSQSSVRCSVPAAASMSPTTVAIGARGHALQGDIQKASVIGAGCG